MVTCEVVHYHCPNVKFYNNRILFSSIELLLNLQTVVERVRGTDYDSANGQILTSVGNDYSNLVAMPGSSNLVDWITKKLLEHNPNANSVEYVNSWVNKMFKNSEALVHCHAEKDKSLDFVAIFYVQVPENSSELVFVEDGKSQTHYYDYDETKRKHIKCQSGDLLIHSPELFHAVTIHNNDIPRICLVFEGRYIV